MKNKKTLPVLFMSALILILVLAQSNKRRSNLENPDLSMAAFLVS